MNLMCGLNGEIFADWFYILLDFAFPSRSSRFATLSDFREEETQDDKERNQYYAGGSERRYE